MAKSHQVLKVSGAIVLDWGQGLRLQIAPVLAENPRTPIESPKPLGRPGRKPSPQTVALVERMQQDAATGGASSIDAYAAFLKEHGYAGSESAARLIVRREMRRHLPAAKAGRKPNLATSMLRERLAADKADAGLRDAGHYVRWLVDKANVGLRKARPIVYREYRRAA